MVVSMETIQQFILMLTNSSQLGNQPLIVKNLQSLILNIECDLPPIKMCLVAQF